METLELKVGLHASWGLQGDFKGEGELQREEQGGDQVVGLGAAH